MKKKGFTLIELLAVIIILAVIALIATPVVLNLIEKMRIKAAESSAKGYTKAVEYGIMNDGYFNNISFDGEYDVENNELAISYQGDGPSSGVFTIEKNKVTYGEFCINGYPIKYENGSGKYTPNLLDCGNVIEKPKENVASELCEGAINYDEVTNINIEKAEDLACISYLSNVGSKTFEGKTLSLISDIDFNDDNSYRDKSNKQIYKDMNGNGVEEDIKTEFTTSSGFKPIGSETVPFSGTFDGNMKTISNLYINRPDESDIGLFGYVDSGIIEGLNIEIANINGNDSVGTIVGYSIESSVIGINTYDATITGTGRAGGIVGYLYSGTIKEVNSNANITSTGQVGGITGASELSGNNIISVIYNGNLTNNNREETGAGGLVSWVENPITISGVVESANITAKYVAKALRADNFSSSSINVYALKNKITLVNTTGNLISNNEGTDYLYEPTLSGYDGALDTWIGGDNDSSGYYFDYDDNNELVVKSVEINPITFTLKGEGTKENPYIINNYQDWKEATTKVKGDYYFKLTNDIDFKDKPYYAMGTTGNYFNGYLDGNYKKLSNIYLTGVNNVGIVGYNNDGIIEGVNIENINIYGNKNVGSIVGYNAKGSVIGINSYNTTITGTGRAGGIVGYLYSGTIKEVNSNANITSTGQVGGITGASELSGNNIISVIYNGNLTNNNREETGAGGLVSWVENPITISGVVESANITAKYVAKALRADNFSSSSINVYALKNKITLVNTTGNSISNDEGTDYLYEPTLSGYDGVLDTIIGGDNDNSGYYFDYDENNKIIVKPASTLVFNLKGNGTESNPYIINNYEDWKKATTQVTNNLYFKLNNNIDFKDKNYYMLGTTANPFNGYLDGNYKTLSNINLTGIDNIGLIGYNNGGTIKGLNINNSNIYGNDNVGTVVGYNASGNVIGINIYNSTVNATAEAGGVVGYLYSGTINEVNSNVNITSKGQSGGITGYSYSEGNNVINVIHNGNITNQNNTSTGASGLVGWVKNAININGVLESSAIRGKYVGRVLRIEESVIANSNINVYVVKNNVSVTGSVNKAQAGTDFTSNITLENYDEVLETILDGDLNNTGYYFDYDSSGTEIIVVPVNGVITTPDGEQLPKPDPNYTMTNVIDGIAPTCELYYVVPVSNGIRASFSCTDDEEVPEVRSLFDSTTEKSAATFDTIGTLKSGSVSGNTKTVISTWNTNNETSQPTKGTCYYFRYGAKDSKGNFSTYVTNICYTGFSE